MVRVDELGAAFARLPVGEAMAEHPPTDTMTSFEHDCVDPTRDEFVGATQPRQTTPDDGDVDHL